MNNSPLLVMGGFKQPFLRALDCKFGWCM
jgi:hypothetical protein